MGNIELFKRWESMAEIIYGSSCSDIIIWHDSDNPSKIVVEHLGKYNHSKNYLKKLIKEHASQYLKSKRFKLVEWDDDQVWGNAKVYDVIYY